MATRNKNKAKKQKKKAAKKRAPATARPLSPVERPITLDEAKALILASPPERTSLRSLSPVVGPTPDTLGAERQRLHDKRRQDAVDRIEEYRAMMTLMKQRGVAAPTGARVTARTIIQRPLQILAEGDSWFEYPVPFFGGSIIPRLADRLGVPILNLAKAGDEVRYMLGVEERRDLIQQLENGCPAGGKWDVLLFSGGGNDIVDNPMALWVKDYDPDVPVTQNIHQQRFDVALALVQAGYEDLIALRDRLSPTTQLFFHAYDWAIPDGRGICHHGPWLKPTFDLRRFPNRAIATAIVREMLEQFARMLARLADSQSRVTLINGQGLLAPKVESWHNELHPTAAGFNKFADLFRERLVAAFPDRVF